MKWIAIALILGLGAPFDDTWSRSASRRMMEWQCALNFDRVSLQAVSVDISRNAIVLSIGVQINIESTYKGVLWYQESTTTSSTPNSPHGLVLESGWHTGYAGHRRPWLLTCGDRHSRVHPQLFLQSFTRCQGTVSFSRH